MSRLIQPLADRARLLLKLKPGEPDVVEPDVPIGLSETHATAPTKPDRDIGLHPESLNPRRSFPGRPPPTPKS